MCVCMKSSRVRPLSISTCDLRGALVVMVRGDGALGSLYRASCPVHSWTVCPALAWLVDQGMLVAFLGAVSSAFVFGDLETLT